MMIQKNRSLIDANGYYPARSRIEVTCDLNSYFSITGRIYHPSHRDGNGYAFGCLHDEIALNFPQLKKYIKWHLTDSDGVPMHYTSNTLHHLRLGNYDFARKTAVWPNVTDDELAALYAQGEQTVANTLAARIPALKAEFAADIKELFVI